MLITCHSLSVPNIHNKNDFNQKKFIKQQNHLRPCLYWFGVFPVMRRKNLQKNEGFGKYNSSAI